MSFSGRATKATTVIVVVAAAVIVCFVALLATWYNQSVSGGHPGTEWKRGIDHFPITQITEDSVEIYIKPLPQLHYTVIGRDDEVQEIVRHVMDASNHSIMILGKPGFGKSTLAIHAGGVLKNEEGLDVFWVNIDKHFDDLTTVSKIKAFYQMIYVWSDLKTKKTVLVLDNFDKLLISSEKMDIFQRQFLKKMASFIQICLVITTQIETSNDNFHPILADEVNRKASVEILSHSLTLVNITDEQKDTIATIVGDCPLALNMAVQVLRGYNLKKGIGDPIEYTIKMLNESKPKDQDAVVKEGWKYYEYIMSLAYDHLETPAQCCGCCVSRYPKAGSFSNKLLLLTGPGVPCNDTIFRNCVNKLSTNSLLDMYSVDDDTRYKMHTLIKSYFNVKRSNQEYHSSYRQMFSLYFSKYCALNENYSKSDLDQSTKLLSLDFHHFQRLIRLIKATGPLNKYEAAVLMIAYQRGEMKTIGEHKLLYDKVCKCEESVDYIRSTIGNEAFGRIVMNVSLEIHSFNFIRCDVITENYCSKALLYNPPTNQSTLKSLFNSEVIKTTCSCFLMYYYHAIGAISILGTLPFLMLMSKFRGSAVEVDVATLAFIYLNFVPSMVKLYFGSDIEKIWLNVQGPGAYGNTWLYSFYAQLVYEFFVIWFGGHFFQQREVLYQVARVRIMNIIMLLLLIGLPLAILQADMMGMYSLNATMLNAAVLLLLIFARRYIFDYVAKKLSNGTLIRLFFRLTLGVLSATSEFACRYIFETSLSAHYFFIAVSVLYIVVFTALLFSYLDMASIM